MGVDIYAYLDHLCVVWIVIIFNHVCLSVKKIYVMKFYHEVSSHDSKRERDIQKYFNTLHEAFINKRKAHIYLYKHCFCRIQVSGLGHMIIHYLILNESHADPLVTHRAIIQKTNMILYLWNKDEFNSN